MSKSCHDCAFALSSGNTLREIGGDLCAAGKGPLFLPGLSAQQNDQIKSFKAGACDRYQVTAPSGGVKEPKDVSGVIALIPDPMSLGSSSASSSLARNKTCDQCKYFIAPEFMVHQGLWPVAACAVRGILIGPRGAHSLSGPAKDCDRFTYGIPDGSALSRMQLIPEYTLSTIGKLTPVSDFARELRVAFKEPSTYETDAPVSEADGAAGVRAWRKIEHDGRHVMLPLFRADYFSESERKLIPRTGDDEHPEEYVDHLGLVYKATALWMELDETPALWGAAGTGKSSPTSTPVLTPTGWRKIGDLQIGDEVIGQNGKATKVTGVFPQGVIPVNRVTMTDESWVLVGDDHLWQTWTAKQEVNWRTGEKRVSPKGSILSTKQLSERGLTVASGYKFRIPMVEPVEYEPVELPLDPFVLGVLIANGSLTSGEAVYSSNNWQLCEEIERRGYDVIERTPTPTRRWTIQGAWQALKQLGLAGEKSRGKFIPESYLRGSVQQRRDLLAALLDCDGSCNGGHTRYHTMSQALAAGVRELVQSLGGTAAINVSSRDGERVVNISVPVNPFMTAGQKRLAWDSVEHHQPARKIKSIEPEGMADQVCIRVEADDHLYVTQDYIVTHNTEFYRHMAWLMGLPFHRISVTKSTEIDDLAGKMHYEPGRGTYFEYGRIPSAWQKPCVICLDEPNVGQPEVWQFIRPLTDNSKQLVLDMNKGERIERHNYAFLGMAMNPAWDVKNSGTDSLADADGSRLMHIYVDLPSPEVESHIISSRVRVDGWEIEESQLNMIMGVATDLRGLADSGALPISWGIRSQIKVARALKWFSPVEAYRLASADHLEPEHQEIILSVVRSHVRSAPGNR